MLYVYEVQIINNNILTGPVLAVPEVHHALAFEGSPRALEPATDPADGGFTPSLGHLHGAWGTLAVPSSPNKIKVRPDLNP